MTTVPMMVDDLLFSDSFFIFWRGQIHADVAGQYAFSLASDDGSRLLIDGQLIVDNGGDHPLQTRSGIVELSAGHHDILVEASENFGAFAAFLSWRPPGAAETVLVPASAFSHRDPFHGQADTGVYTLTASGATGGPAPLAVTATSLPDDGLIPAGVTQYAVTFNRNILETSITTDDLKFNGQPLATSVAVAGNVATFTLPAALTGGSVQLDIAGGSITSIAGSPVAPFTSAAATVDAIAPRVTAVSVAPGSTVTSANVAGGSFSVDIQFDEPIGFPGIFSAVSPAATSLQYNPATRTVTANFTGIVDSAITLTLNSAAGGFTDLGLARPSAAAAQDAA